MEGYM